MPMAEPSTPQPTYGAPAISSRPCSAPSSPCVPCTIGKKTSTPKRPDSSDGSRRWSAALGASTVRASAPSPTRSPPAAPGPRSAFDSISCQPPSRPMPISTGSKRWGSSAFRMPRADITLTSCSPERPPKITPTRSLRSVMRARPSIADPGGAARARAPASDASCARCRALRTGYPARSGSRCSAPRSGA